MWPALHTARLRPIAFAAFAVLAALAALTAALGPAGEARAQNSTAATELNRDFKDLAPHNQTGDRDHDLDLAEADTYTFYLLTMGPGDELFSRYGHNAVAVQGGPTGRVSRVYNFGTFDPTDPAMLPNFIRGILKYYVSIFSYAETVYFYRMYDRTMWRQELRLTRKGKLALLRELDRANAPENRAYIYHFFNDNCSTRVRDIIDRAVQGDIRRAFATKASDRTLRRFIVDANAPFAPVAFGIYTVMNAEVDRPITLWDEMFMPEQMMKLLSDWEYRTPDGFSIKLLGQPTVSVLRRAKDKVPMPPLVWTLVFMFLPMALFFILAAALKGKGPLSIVTGRAGFLVWALFAGTLGVAMTFMWAVSGHTNTHANGNLVWFPPTHLWLLTGVRRWGRTGTKPKDINEAKERGKIAEKREMWRRRTLAYITAHLSIGAAYIVFMATGIAKQQTGWNAVASMGLSAIILLALFASRPRRLAPASAVAQQ
jgi:hypothetical protein